MAPRPLPPAQPPSLGAGSVWPRGSCRRDGPGAAAGLSCPPWGPGVLISCPMLLNASSSAVHRSLCGAGSPLGAWVLVGMAGVG